MRDLCAKFVSSEDGAVTVDWVVLTAAVVGLAIVVVATILNVAVSESAGIAAYIDSNAITTF